MVESFSFSPGGKLLYGNGEIFKLPGLVDRESSVLICGSSFLKQERIERVTSDFSKIHVVNGEPDPDVVDLITRDVKGKVKSVVAAGGGSALDTGKAVAAMCCSEGSVEDYLEGVGTEKPSGETLPLIAIPTTAGTGSEATKNAVISRRGEQGYKKSLRHDNYIPSIALIDPELYLSSPGPIMASCGMDAFSQLLESFISTKSNVYTDALAWKGLRLYIDNFPDLFNTSPRRKEAMGKIALGAYFSGITLANAGLGTVHGLAGPLGGFFTIPHGTACGTLLPEVMRRTAEKLSDSDKPMAEITLKKLDSLGRYAGGSDREALLNLLDSWLEQYEIKPLSNYGIKSGDIEKVVRSSGNKNNPYEFSPEEMESLLKSRI